jgi:hypothetical protein
MRTRIAQKPHQTNLENIQEFPQMMESIETIEPYIRPRWWSSKMEIKIDENIIRITREQFGIFMNLLQEIVCNNRADLLNNGA